MLWPRPSPQARANERLLAELRGDWRTVFTRMFRGEPPGHRRVPTVGFDAAMRALYGEGALPATEPSCTRESRPEHGEWG